MVSPGQTVRLTSSAVRAYPPVRMEAPATMIIREGTRVLAPWHTKGTIVRLRGTSAPLHRAFLAPAQ